MDCLGSVDFPSGTAATQGSGIASMGFGGPSMAGINLCYFPHPPPYYFDFVLFRIMLMLGPP